MAEEHEKRNPLTTKKQIEMIINFLENNSVLTSGSCNATDIRKVDEKWLELTNELNNSGVGPIKTVKQWKDVVKELKTNVKKKARDINLATKGTGGGPRKVKELTELEERLLCLISKVVVEGLPDIAEPGLLIADETPEELQETVTLEETEEQENNVVYQNNLEDETSSSSVPKKRRRRQQDLSIKNRPLITSLNDQIKAMNNLAKSINKLATALDKLADKYPGV